MSTVAATADAHEETVRRALLQRLADSLSVIANADRYHWTCCWLDYSWHGSEWTYQLCGGRLPGHFITTRREHCGHWHHGTEVFLANG